MSAASLFALFALLLAGAAQAEPVGSVTHLSGTLSAQRSDGSKVLLSVRSAVNEGDLLATVRDTFARIKFVDGAEVVLRPDSQLKVEKYSYAEEQPESDSVILGVLKGGLRKVTGLVGKRNRASVSINTPTATIGIRGTHFGALLCQDDCAAIPTVTGKPLPDGLHLDVVEGAIVVKNPLGEQVVPSGQFAYVKDRATLPLIVPAAQGVRVTMPPAISQNKSDGRTLDTNNSDDQCTVK